MFGCLSSAAPMNLRYTQGGILAKWSINKGSLYLEQSYGSSIKALFCFASAVVLLHPLDIIILCAHTSKWQMLILGGL